jgi:glycosyltransferase involved in cell wall biosynthesis
VNDAATAPLHVVHVITGLGLGGAEMMLYKVLAQMDRERFSAEVVSLSSAADLRPAIEALDVPVTMLGMTGLPSLAGAVMTLRARIRASTRPTVVQTWMYHADLLGGLAARAAGSPVIWDLQGAVPDLHRMRRTTRAAVRTCSRLSSVLPARIVSCGHATARSHVALGYDQRRIEVIPNAVDTEAFKPDAAARRARRDELGIPHDAFVAGLGARLDPLKDHETMFAAWALYMRTARRDSHLLLFGTDMVPDHPQVQAWQDRYGARNVHLLGRRSDVAALFAACDVGCLTSVSEGLPNIVAEAMACGAPCVVTDVGDSAWVAGPMGVVVPARDAAAFAAGLHAFAVMDPQQLAASGRAARAHVERTFDIRASASRYYALYEEVSAGRP